MWPFQPYLFIPIIIMEFKLSVDNYNALETAVVGLSTYQ